MKPKKPARGRFAWRIQALLSVAFLCILSCVEVRDQTTKTSSETHFLRRCYGQGACAEGFSCLCGVCTQTCEQGSACAALTVAGECLPVASRPSDPACPETAVVAFCDVACSENEDCAELGNGYGCDRGFCRALSDSCQTGETTGSEVALLGDALIADTHQLTRALEDLARDSGALAAGASYRDYSEPLDNHLGGDAPGLAKQYAAAQQAGAVRVVVMNGGGGDLVTNGCPDPIASDCPTIQDAVSGANVLWNQMAEDGVEHLVFFFYPDPQINARLKTMADTLRPLLEQTCANAPLPCHWLDLRPTFAGKYDEYIVPGRLTQTEAGSRASARAIWGLMQQYCVAQ